jgi:hypothetical protein
MNCHAPQPRTMFATLIALTFLCCALNASDQIPADAAASRDRPLPKFADAEAMIVRYFEALPGYQPGGILARGEVEPIYQHLARMGWQVGDWKSIADRVPADGSFLVRQLRTRDGRKFMAQISKYALGYDRLDRLSKLPRGPELIRQFIRGPEGYKMIQYMTETPGGKNLGTMLSQAPDGKDFNKPTGQIYTLDALLDVLKEQYDEAERARQGGPTAGKPGQPPAPPATAPRGGSK